MMSIVHVTPHQTATVRLRFGKIVSDDAWLPGFHWKHPFTTCVDMFTGFDKDEVRYTCGTKDGVQFKGTIVVTNQLPASAVVEAYRYFGKYPDKQNVYDMGEYFMQSICANMTAREFYVDKFNILDDLLEEKMVEGQKAAYDDEGNLVRPSTGIRIVEGKVKVFKPTPINSNIDELIKAEAEHRQAVRTAKEQRKVDEVINENAALKQAAELERERARNLQEEQRRTDTQNAELERALAKLESQKERLRIENEMALLVAQRKSNITLIEADAKKREKELEAQGNEALLTKPYLTSQAMEAFFHNTKFVMGDSIPSAWIDLADNLQLLN